MFPGALHQIRIDEVLIWNARLLGHVFEVFDRLPREVHGHRPAGRNGIGVRLRVAEIIFVARVNVLFLHIARSRGGWSSYRILLSPSACRHLASAHAAFHIYPLLIHKALPANTCERHFVCVAGRAVTAWHFADFLWIVLACCQVL